MISIQEKNKVISEFPNDVELKRYKNINYIQDHQDYYLFIPKGLKYFVWFKNEEPQKCYFLQYKQQEIINCQIKYVSIVETLFNNNSTSYNPVFL